MSISTINDGFILINKDINKTSFETVNALRKILSIKKAGHAGTLDKNASGLLVVACGKATKLLKYFFIHDKSYEADICFGSAKNTDDANGIDIKKYEGTFDFSLIKKELKNFEGKIEQTPPLFSAVHVNGERSYKLALRNENVKLSKREVTINKLDILSFNAPILKVFIECSTGTYIRSIARDLGDKTGYYAYLHSLKRTTVGNFSIENSYTLESIRNNDYKIIPATEALSDLESIRLKKDFLKSIKNGMEIKAEWFEENLKDQNGIYKVLYEKELLAVIKIRGGIFSYDLVY